MGFFDSIANAFSRDGIATRILEKVPVVGYGVAGVQALAGNTEHAKRALATSTNSLITTAGAVGGMVVGGPAGAIAGGAAASTIGLGTEYAISTTINDKDVKGDVGEVTVQRVVTDMAIGGVSGLIGGGAGATAAGKAAGKAAIEATASTLAKTGFEGAAKVIITNVGKSAAGAVTTGSLASLVQGASKNVFNNTPNVKEPEPKPPKVRKVTQNQDARAKDLIQDLKAFVLQYPLYWLNDAYAQVHLYWEPVVIAGLPWDPANQAVQGQYQAFQQKKTGNPALNEKPLRQKIYEELKQIVDDHNNGVQLGGNKQKILDMIIKKEPGGFNAVWGEVESGMNLRDLRLQSFSELMILEVEFMD
ncbi:uncharacterized protein QC761_116455 [Podospora bellae-mahoneyi]|uniref:Uncharacterized protein n=1 Tax=Podospora bellae-mahoneyi TaxID=2093777 RepID=A0ABR0G097_9PEZI|nr:hypothetical protein QC761_116455 [Podospora bellae-mahoneyi]